MVINNTSINNIPLDEILYYGGYIVAPRIAPFSKQI